MTDTATETRSVVIERTFRHPLDKLWRALTESWLLAEWMMPNDFSPEVGTSFTFRAEPVAQWNGIVEGEVLEVVPQRRLRYRWGTGPLSWIVTIDLTAVDEGVHLRFEGSGIPPEPKGAAAGARYGWEQKFLPALDELLDRM